jgi:hypothetical protein
MINNETDNRCVVNLPPRVKAIAERRMQLHFPKPIAWRR